VPQPKPQPLDMRRVAKVVEGPRREFVTTRRGIVVGVSASPALVDLEFIESDTQVLGIPYFSWYSPTVGDMVRVLEFGDGMVVLGTYA
jgi:hypothetical protein